MNDIPADHNEPEPERHDYGFDTLAVRAGQRRTVIANCCMERVQSNVACNNQICCRFRKRGVSNSEVVGLACNAI